MNANDSNGSNDANGEADGDDLEDFDELEDGEAGDDEAGDEAGDDDDNTPTVDQVKRMIAAIPQYMPDAKFEVNGQVMTAQDIVAQLQGYLDAVAATQEARRQLEAAERAAEESAEDLEAALRAHHANLPPSSQKN